MKLRPNGLTVLAIAFLCFMVLPMVAIFWNVHPAQLAEELKSSETLDALKVSGLSLAWVAIILVGFGAPLAWAVGKAKSRNNLVESVVQAPAALPPAVAGIGLLLAFGPDFPLGRWLIFHHVEISLSFTAVVLAQLFVAAPFFVTPLQESIRAAPTEIWEAGKVDGLSESQLAWRLGAPMLFPAALAALGVAIARAMGEFGATILFAGSFQGRTQTMSLAIYDLMQSDLDRAIAVSAILMVLALVLGLASRSLLRRTKGL